VKRTALLVGATGLTGQALLSCLLDDERYQQVLAPVRTQPGWQHAKLHWLAIDAPLDQPFDSLVDTQVTDFFCTLGTTRKQAGRAGLAAVDRDLVVQFAQQAKALGAQRACILSAIGANAQSPFLYNRLKGQMQQQVTALGFERLVFMQPSVLLGQRAQHRGLEHLAGKLLAHQGWGRYQAMPATQVASAMWRSLSSSAPGEFYFEVQDIQQLNKEGL
jgi:uncharacterized protein YbjT (DUF2867 family)